MRVSPDTGIFSPNSKYISWLNLDTLDIGRLSYSLVIALSGVVDVEDFQITI